MLHKNATPIIKTYLNWKSVNRIYLCSCVWNCDLVTSKSSFFFMWCLLFFPPPEYIWYDQAIDNKGSLHNTDMKRILSYKNIKWYYTEHHSTQKLNCFPKHSSWHLFTYFKSDSFLVLNTLVPTGLLARLYYGRMALILFTTGYGKF